MPKLILYTTITACVLFCLAPGCEEKQSVSPEKSPVEVAPKDLSNNFPALTRVGGCQIVFRNGKMILSAPTNDRSLVQTKEIYTPPFAMHLRAKTDKTNIRLYYNAGMIILGWECRPSELRFHNPIDDKVLAYPGKGMVKPNQYYDIVWEMYPDGMRLLVNGKEAFRKSGEFGQLAAPVGIGPAFGSVITVESFSVRDLIGTLEETK